MGVLILQFSTGLCPFWLFNFLRDSLRCMIRFILLLHLPAQQVIIQIIILPVTGGLVSDRTSGFRHLTECQPSGGIVIQQAEGTLVLFQDRDSLADVAD